LTEREHGGRASNMPVRADMRYLYLDNFRGFDNANIPIRDVNFLVGENSTGKTSFLNMLKILSNPVFIMSSGESSGMGEMMDEELVFGHFAEMVSAHSEDQSYFRVGSIIEPRSKKQQYSGILLTYKKVSGLAKISRITCTVRGKEISIWFRDDKVFYKKRELPELDDIIKINAAFSEWIRIHKNGRDHEWKEATGFPQEMPIVFLLHAIAQLESENSSDVEVSFSLPFIGAPLVWIAPIRSRPRRTYDEPQTLYSSEGLHTPYAIKRMLASAKDAKKFKDFIERVGAESGLFERVEIKSFGDSETSPFEVNAYLDGKALSIMQMGYGVSQSLPIFVELLDRPKGSWFAIQQPEVHLHPRAQAALGDVFFEMATRDNKRFVVETHSDFTIDRFRLNFRSKGKKKEKAKAPDSQVLFFERHNRRNVVTPLPIDNDGKLPSEQPDSYRDFFIREQMQLLEV
jgi:AAA domain, putative AbiEii toxin, Type IV TA system